MKRWVVLFDVLTEKTSLPDKSPWNPEKSEYCGTVIQIVLIWKVNEQTK